MIFFPKFSSIEVFRNGYPKEIAGWETILSREESLRENFTLSYLFAKMSLFGIW